MTTLHKFKLLATRCTVAGSPTMSPTTSPVVHLRRRRSTLRMLLSRGGGGCGGGRRLPPRREVGSQDQRGDGKSSEKGKEIVVSHKLKDLFVSTPSAFDERVSESMREGLLQSSGVDVARRRRPLSAMFRQRLLRRAWRPVLGTIPDCADDRTILTTTYEGTHNHPLPPESPTRARSRKKGNHWLELEVGRGGTCGKREKFGVFTFTDLGN
ncbi:uncharacterized protein Fot_05477 [Forsythia ovata]|uniref:WRKY domain-containing protein n=1 Tax=Forsythia ovata TaxID=205694 RepID=A0ABD1WT31_9LAMI